MKKNLTLMAALIGAAISSAAEVSGVCGKDCQWHYNTANRSLTIKGTGAMNNYVPVQANYSASDAPWSNYAADIAKVDVQNGITDIGEYAFYMLKAMKQANIAASVAHIRQHAFHGTGLYAVSISSGVISVGAYAFSYSFDLKSAIIGNNVVSIGEHAFDNCAALSEVVLGSRVARIETSAFQYCRALTEINFPKSIVYIGEHAFHNCSNLRQSNLPSSAKVGDYAFYGTPVAIH